MKRYLGLMPNGCVEITKYFKDRSGFNIMIEAGPEGWTILWADYGVDCCDKNDTSENNFKAAYDKAVESVGPLIEIVD